MLGLQVRLQGFEILVKGDIELEQRIATAYLLLDEHQALRDLGCSRTTAHIPPACCSSTFAGNRVGNSTAHRHLAVPRRLRASPFAHRNSGDGSGCGPLSRSPTSRLL